MSRNESIAVITSKLATLDDEQVSILANFAQDLAEPAAVPLDLTADERAAIERSKGDFKAGRTYSDDAYRAEMARFMAGLKSKYP